MEVFWTGLCALRHRDFKLSANTSIWMFFIYGMIVFLEPVYIFLQPYPLVARGAIYAICIFAGEFITGGFLKKVNLCPWDYTHCRYSIQGIIRLDYAPVWFMAGLIFEQVFSYLEVI